MIVAQRVIRTLATLGLAASAASAQQLPGGGGGGGAGGAQSSQFQQRLAQIVQSQLGLSDAQLQQVIAVNKKYEEQRFMLVQQERDIRISIRDEILRGDKADQTRIARLLDEMMKVQGTRLQIVQNEQKDLATFLTPVQRAKYLAIQERVRQRLQQMRQGAAQGEGMAGEQGKGQGQAYRRRMQQQQREEAQQQAPAPPPPAPPPGSPLS